MCSSIRWYYDEVNFSDERDYKNQNFDKIIRICFENITATNFDNNAWQQICLPMKLGGFGLRSTSIHSNAAYISSQINTTKLIGSLCKLNNYSIADLPINNAFTNLQFLGCNININSNSDLIYSQRNISSIIDEALQKELISKSDTNNKLRLTAVGIKHASDWIKSLPNSALNHKLKNEEYSILVKLWTGTQIINTNSVCKAKECSKSMDIYAHHALTCHVAGDRLFRHNLIRDWLFNLAAEASLEPSSEKKRFTTSSS